MKMLILNDTKRNTNDPNDTDDPRKKKLEIFDKCHAICRL